MPNYVIKSFRGGHSDFEDKGIAGSFKYGRNLNIRKKTDSLSCNQALMNVTPPGGGFTDLIDWWVPSSDGNVYGFGRDGKIYKVTSNDTVTVVYTDGNGAILGAWEWGISNGKKYLFWATATRLNAKEIPGASDWSDVNASIVVGSNTYTYPKTNLTSAINHMMLGMGGGIGALVINNDETLAMVGYDGSYTNEILRFTPGNAAKALLQRGNNAIIGTYAKNQLVKTALFSWDGNDSQDVFGWDDTKPLPIRDISAMIDTEVNLIIDDKGQLFHADTVSGLPIFIFPTGSKVSPGGVTNDDYMALLGIWGCGTGKTGIWSYGRKRKNGDPLCPNLEYQFDCDEIGGVIKVGDRLLASYKSGSSYGVKKIDPNNKAVAVYESLDLKQPDFFGMLKSAQWGTIPIFTAPLPAGCSVSVKYRLNKNTSGGGDGWKTADLQGGGTVFDTEGGQEAVFQAGDQAKIAELQITLTPNGNATPEVYYANPNFS